MLKSAQALHQAGNLVAAERTYRSILSARPDQFDALHYLGVLEAQRGRHEEALRLIGLALTVKPQSIEAHMSLVNVLKALGRHNEALAFCDKVLNANPKSAPAHYNRGNVLLDLNRYEEALASYGKVLAIMPGNAMALYNHGNVLQQLGRHAEAVASYDRLLAIAPGNAAALYNRGVAMMGLKRYEEALASYDRALAIAPDDVEVLTNRGITLYELKRYEEALASYDRALAIKPDLAEALNNRANVLLDLKQPQEALASCERALAIRPDYLEALNNRGIALQVLNRNQEALASYDRATSLDPESIEAHWNGSLCRLLLGDYANGWREYEWRWRAEDFLALSPKRDFRQPLWLGREDIAGKTIFVHAEQGFGYTIQFCRYAEWLAQKGARVILEVQPPLKSLLAGIRGASLVLAQGEALPEFDCHCPMASLPLAFGTRLESIPCRVPYLSPSPQHIDKWQAKLGPKARPRIGLAWSGRITHTKQHERSIPLDKLLPLADAGVSLVSLQKDVQPQDREVLAAHAEITHFGSELADFSDTAALLSLMDVVISIDTSSAHLAGALGRPVWILLPYVADWRWLLEREDSPWYPTARLCRQAAAGDWDSVVPGIARLLREHKTDRHG